MSKTPNNTPNNTNTTPTNPNNNGKERNNRILRSYDGSIKHRKRGTATTRMERGTNMTQYRFWHHTPHVGGQPRTLRDAMYGEAIGDALGVPYEFNARDTFTCTGMAWRPSNGHNGADDGVGTWHQPVGTWSDDTGMALATCDSLRKLGRVDTDDMHRAFIRWRDSIDYNADTRFDIGRTTAEALEQGQGLSGERDNGNGSLMRIIPLAFTDASDDEIRAVSAITHAHRMSCEACVTYVRYARLLRDGASPLEALHDERVAHGLRGVASSTTAGIPVDDLTIIPELDRIDVASSGFVIDTLVAAIWCLTDTTGYSDCVLEAVNLGEDTDTTAAVAGGLAGIVYGMDAIPDEWLRLLRGKDVIDRCIDFREND